MSTGKKYAGVRALLIFFIMCFASHAQNARGPKNALPYRGMRMSEWDGLFYVTKIESEREENDLIEIEIKFNIPADPRTLRNELIRIDGKPLPPDARIVFNKAGTKIKILLRRAFLFGAHAQSDRPFQIDLAEAKSFNAVPIYSSRFPDLRFDREYEFRFVRAMPKKMRDGMYGETYDPPPPDARNGMRAAPPAKAFGDMNGTQRENPDAVFYGEYLRFEDDD